MNRKGYNSIVMQALVDSKYLFRDVVVGWPGSVHDSNFSNSGLYKKGNEGTLLAVTSMKPYKSATYNGSFSMTQPTHFFPGLSKVIQRIQTHLMSKGISTTC